MRVDQKVKEAEDFVREGYSEAEGKVDGWFARNKHTVAILSGVAVGIGSLAIAFIYCVASHG